MYVRFNSDLTNDFYAYIQNILNEKLLRLTF